MEDVEHGNLDIQRIMMASARHHCHEPPIIRCANRDHDHVLLANGFLGSTYPPVQNTQRLPIIPVVLVCHHPLMSFERHVAQLSAGTLGRLSSRYVWQGRLGLAQLLCTLFHFRKLISGTLLLQLMILISSCRRTKRGFALKSALSE
ncbi:hypothetical protein M404DRAFT_996556 [Pisolithus tinctorius Marx 270]|uniref:Uncharacterized protein n=1 Tax=Pisolithus tinctorius Marx 270 TaxID=870435 RepID=A0A0C3PMX5_PISTI|nr:hypothetical protein M404DRAFT_996556 [Pisolithus tinctorius Marx 270]